MPDAPGWQVLCPAELIEGQGQRMSQQPPLQLCPPSANEVRRSMQQLNGWYQTTALPPHVLFASCFAH